MRSASRPMTITASGRACGTSSFEVAVSAHDTGWVPARRASTATTGQVQSAGGQPRRCGRREGRSGVPRAQVGDPAWALGRAPAGPTSRRRQARGACCGHVWRTTLGCRASPRAATSPRGRSCVPCKRCSTLSPPWTLRRGSCRGPRGGSSWSTAAAPPSCSATCCEHGTPARVRFGFASYLVPRTGALAVARGLRAPRQARALDTHGP